MNIAPPTPTQIDAAVAASERTLRRTIRRRQLSARVGIALGAVVAIGIGGTGAATAFFPQYTDLEGVVKTVYVDDFVECIQDAGWDAAVLSAEEAAPILQGWGAATSTYSVVSNHLAKETQGEAGRAISACQEELSADAGETIMFDEW